MKIEVNEDASLTLIITVITTGIVTIALGLTLMCQNTTRVALEHGYIQKQAYGQAMKMWVKP